MNARHGGNGALLRSRGQPDRSIGEEPDHRWNVNAPLLFVLTLVSYWVGARVAFKMADISGLGAVFFAPAGVTVGFLLRTRRSRWWAVLVAAAVAEISLDLTFDLPVTATVGFAAANTMEPLLGAVLTEQWTRRRRVDLSRRRHTAGFVVGAGAVATFVGAAIGAVTDRVVNGDDTWLTWWQWWLGDALGVLVVGGTILAWTSSPDPRPLTKSAGLGLVALTAAATTTAALGSDLPLELLVTAVIVMAGGFFGLRGASSAAVVFASTVMVVVAVKPGTLWMGVEDATALALIKAQLAISTVVSLVLAAEAHHRRRTEEVVARAEHQSASERQLRSVFESIDEGFCIAEMIVDDAGSPTDYRFLAINPLFEVMTGLKDPVGKTALQLVPDLEQVWIDTYGRVGLGRETVRFEQGSEAMGRRFDVFAVPVEPHGRFAIVFKDETARHAAQQLLRESEERFRTMADRLPVMVWQQDAEGNQELVNQTFCEFFGVSRDQMQGDPWPQLLHPDDRDMYVDAFSAAVAECHDFHQEVRVVDGRGELRWIESWASPRYADGSYVGHLGTSADITERKRAEAELAESHRFVTEITALVPGVVYVFDLDQGSNIYVNRRTSELLGHSSEQVLALGPRFIAEVVHPDDAESLVAHIKRTSELAEGETASIEYRFRHRDGTWHWFLSSDVVLRRDPSGRPTQLLGLAIDVTERKRAETTLRSAAALDAYRARLGDELREESDPVEVQAHAAGTLGAHLGATRVHYAEVDEAGELGVVAADYHVGSASVVGRYRFDDYGVLLMSRFRAGETVVVPDVAADYRLTDAERERTTALDIGAYVLAPLIKRGRPVAAIAVHHRHAHEWTVDELAVIAETAERTWAAVERAHAERALRLKRFRAELLADLIAALETRASVAEQLQSVVDAVVPAFADYASVEMPSEPEQPLLAVAHRDPGRIEALRTLRQNRRVPDDDPRSVARAAAGDPLLLTEITPDLVTEYSLSPATADLLTQLSPTSLMSVPLDWGAGARGVLMLGLNGSGRPPYTQDDLEFVQEVAHRVGLVLGAARLRWVEHDIALRLQRALLPDSLVWHPDLEIEARYRAASAMLEVGGDWYDTFAWPDGRIGVIVGDVVGHSLDSAAAMGRLRAATTALATRLESRPDAMLEALDEYARGPDGTSFATALCLIIDPTNGHVTYSSAGHPPALLVTTDGEVRRLEQAQSSPLCTFKPTARPVAETTLTPGSLIVIYTDGLVERRGEPIDDGIARLERLAAQHRQQPIGELAETLASVNDQPAVDDDIVVVCVRFAPARARFAKRFPARTIELSAVRADVRRWLDERGVVGIPQGDILLGIGEACTNAVEHAFRNVDGEVGLELDDHGHYVVARVADAGIWKTPAVDTRRGRGIPIMRALTTHLDHDIRADGATVTLTFATGNHD